MHCSDTGRVQAPNCGVLASRSHFAAGLIHLSLEGRTELQTHAAWLKADHADAAASLLQGIDEMFTSNDLGLTPALIRSPGLTNIVENPNGMARA